MPENSYGSNRTLIEDLHHIILLVLPLKVLPDWGNGYIGKKFAERLIRRAEDSLLR